MSLILSGTNGLSDVDGSAATPAIRGTDTNTGIFFPAADTVGISTGGTERARVDSSGNLGLGVTPSYRLDVSSSNTSSVRITGAGTSPPYLYSYSDSGGVGWMNATPYSSGALYYLTGNAHNWFVGSSQAMTLNSSGNLGVGTTSMSYPLTRNGITLKAKGTDGAEFVMLSSTDTGFAGLALVRTGVDAAVVNRTTGSLIFATDVLERARIDSSGNLLVGQTSSGLQNSTSFAAGPSAAGFVANHASGVGGGTSYGVFGYNGSSIGSITQAGTTQVNFNGNSVPPSDARLKENIVDAPLALPLISEIKIKSFDWIGDGHHQTYGAIAQELQIVAPEFVPSHDDPEAMLGVDYGKMVPMLIKAIQEQQALIVALREELDAVKTKVGA